MSDRPRVLDGLVKNGSVEATLDSVREIAEDPDLPTVRRWREGGGKVLGHFQVYFPEELAHAAGMLPVKVRGAPVEPRQADSRFGSYLCSIVKTSLELALSGRLDLAMFVTHPICDAARNLAAVWGRNTRYPCRILYLPQNANSGWAADYLASEYRRLQAEIAEVAGARVGPDDLARSLAVFNENRRLIRGLYALRREKPWLLDAHECQSLLLLAGLVPREEHNRLLAGLLPRLEGRQRRRRERLRVALVGGFCEQPPLDLLRMLSGACDVVDDDLLVGLRWIVEDVPADSDPLASLARAYLESSTHSPVQHDRRKPKGPTLVEMARKAGAQAVIVTAAKMCEPGLEEQVAWVGALDAAGIPCFVSEFEENMTSFDHLAIQLETFAENLLFD